MTLFLSLIFLATFGANAIAYLEWGVRKDAERAAAEDARAKRVRFNLRHNDIARLERWADAAERGGRMNDARHWRFKAARLAAWNDIDQARPA